ncbi:MAG: fasciclin domain-containing protein [Deltaproteobacteria bacterium]|nr:fasciclin domain-containing protein [Deltaproteobacteria bacterium]
MRLLRTHLVPLALLIALALSGCGDGATGGSDTSRDDASGGDADVATDADVGATDVTPGDGTDDLDAATPSDGTADSETAPSDTSSPADTAIDPDILEGNSIIGVASRAGTFKTFLAAAQRMDLVPALATDELTVFAPTDAAFEAYRVAAGLSAEELLASPRLGELLRYHVVAGALDATALAAEPKRASLIDVALYVDTSDGVRLNVVDQVAGATVVSSESADNGVLYTLDAVLVPPKLIEVAKLEGLAGFPVSLEAANLEGIDDEDAQHTLFAPSNTSFFDLLRARGQTAVEFLADPEMPDIMRYLVVVGRYLSADLLALDGTTLPSTLRQVPAAPAEPYFSPITLVDVGGSLRVNNATVAVADIIAVNGVIHIMGLDVNVLPRDVKTQMGGLSMDTFLSALESQGLTAELVAPEGPVTVFGPYNGAFVDFSPNDVVGGFHIVPGVLLPADLARAAGTGLQTLAGTTCRCRWTAAATSPWEARVRRCSMGPSPRPATGSSTRSARRSRPDHP